MLNSNTTPARRTWKVTIPVMLEGAWQMTLTHTVTALRIGNQILGAFVDGVEATLERAAHLLTWAKAEGTLEVLETIDAAQPSTIGNRAAHALHLDLARLGYGRGFAVASEVLGREVTSLAALSTEDTREVLSFAYGQLGLPTMGLVAA